MRCSFLFVFAEPTQNFFCQTSGSYACSVGTGTVPVIRPTILLIAHLLRLGICLVNFVSVRGMSSHPRVFHTSHYLKAALVLVLATAKKCSGPTRIMLATFRASSQLVNFLCTLHSPVPRLRSFYFEYLGVIEPRYNRTLIKLACIALTMC